MTFDDVTCCAQLADFTLPEKIVLSHGDKKSKTKDDTFVLTARSSEFGGKKVYSMCYQNKRGEIVFFNTGETKLTVLNKTKMAVMRYIEKRKKAGKIK